MSIKADLGSAAVKGFVLFYFFIKKKKSIGGKFCSFKKML